MTSKQSASARMVLEVRDGEENPFWTIEALGEQIGSLGYCLSQAGITINRPPYNASTEQAKEFWDSIPSEHRDILYHFLAAEKYQQQIFQYVAALLPKLYAASDGDTEALASIKDELTALAQAHQEKWDRQ